MFNLLGNLLFGYRQETDSESISNQAEEASTLKQNDICLETTSNQSTQTHSSNNENDRTTTSNEATSQASATECWILVDQNDEDGKCVPSPLQQLKADMATSMSAHVNTDVNNCVNTKSMTGSALLGSFFEKHEQEDEEFNRKYKAHEACENRDWLITPLPCLTSITASQRSIENDPLENLLIEHPSMSVFVAATSSSVSESSFQDEEEEEENMVVEQAQVEKVEEVKPVMRENTERFIKRKAMPISNAETSPVVAGKQRKNKKNKKSEQSVGTASSPSGSVSNVSTVSSVGTNNNNKENVQVWLASDAKKQARNHQAKLEQLLFNKNQMKRANKAKQINSNFKQRKYHKLQQPSFLSTYNKTVF